MLLPIPERIDIEEGLHICNASNNITETALVALTKLKNLEILRVSNISDSFIIRLKVFNCAGCKNLTDTGIIQFIKNNPDLENIYANDINNITIALVIGADQATKNRTNGIILRLQISNKSIIEASKSTIKSQCIVNNTALKKLTELENLECLILNSEAELHEESITVISNNCKKLKHLEIPYCPISSYYDGNPLSSLTVYVELSKLQYLEYLNLSHRKNLSDSTIIAIANNCKNLKKLDIQSCTGLTETALVALTNLENLQKLDVSFLDVITDSFVIKLKGLKALRCEGCQKLTDDGIIQFIENNPHLEFLDVCSICIDITMNIVIAANSANKNRTNVNSLPEEINEIHLFFERRPIRKSNIPMTIQRFRSLQKLTLAGFCLDNIILKEIADITTLVHLNIELSRDIHENFFPFTKLVNLEYIVLNMAEIPRKNWINFKNLEYLSICCEIMPDLANTIVEYCKNLSNLRIHFPQHVNSTALKKLTELKNLECLMLGPGKLHEESIIAILNNCKKLKRLEFPGCVIVPSINGNSFSSPSVLDEFSKLQCLEHLNLEWAQNLNDSTITAIANNCKNLNSLDVSVCLGLTETALVAITNLENLQKLHVTCLNTITDSFLIKLKGLKELNCHSCLNSTSVGIIQFIKNNPDLELIIVRGIKNITIDMVIAADQATKNRTNDIEGDNEDKKNCTKVLNTIFCKCKNLKHLNIPNDFYDLAEISFEKWENFKNLEYLNLSCSEVLPDLADTIVKYCKNLKHLYMNSTCDFRETYVVKKLTKLENLERLAISHESLSEEEIIAISNNCKKLKHLELVSIEVSTGIDNDDELSSPSVFKELSKLQYLEHLSLSYTDNIEDSTIIAIANNCKNLKYLDVIGTSDDITETALLALTKLKNLEILKVGPHLEYIFAYDMDNITIDLVIGADQATKNRTNGIILRLQIPNKSIIEASKSIIKSQWLVVGT
ncbi:uncharacterized protein LOC122848022 [Aphidius gifuensis]|uniref:uncharacterized protein LOC122848022 n=1 Tax=Aphidius gifuensis TaxID=684658 RepID=UPI001CDB7904|nr:uncharacterized protein LOC122848022 [Aphidius gifuensis]